VNETNIRFTNGELILLNKGLKYNLGHKPKHWIRDLGLEAECAIALLPPEEQEYTRHQVAKQMKKLQTRQTPQNRYSER